MLLVKLLTGLNKPQRVESYEEACIEIAATMKSYIRTWGGRELRLPRPGVIRARRDNPLECEGL